MASIAGISINPTLEQIFLYNIAGTLIGAALSPYANAIANEVNSVSPLLPISPADLASAVIRGELDEPTAAGQAAMSGINAERFHTLVRITGQSLGPGELATALRLGLIDDATYIRGIRQGNMRDEWADTVKELAIQRPAPTSILAAYLEGQVAEGEARSLYAKLGGDPAYFDLLYHTEGQAPTPSQALELANRGVIPWDGTGPDAVSYEQAFLEGPWRNKWEASFRALGEYLPPPRTVTAMYKEGSLTHDRAAELLRKQGLAPDLAEAYLVSGAAQKTQATKDLAQSTYVTLYRDRVITRDTAAAAIVSLGYDATEADYILTIEDLRLAEAFIRSAIGRIHTLYVGHKIPEALAIGTLTQLGLPPAGIPDLIAIWAYERAANVKSLTPAEIAAAFKAQLVDQPTAQAKLEELGYLPYDAWLYLSIHMKQALPDQPPPSSVGGPPAP